MSGLEILGLIFLIVIGIFLPRTIASFLGALVLGGGLWWWVFGPIMIVGIVLDIATKAIFIHAVNE